tara:strand:- start:10009 stop:11172 length:1164 start_codon:yes stop_codon:yes gene_type:complete
MAGIVVKPRARIYHGHDWVYGTDVRKIFGEPKPGDVVSLKDYKDRPLGSAIYNPNSQIVARRFSRRKQDLDLDFFKRRIERADEVRQRLGFDSVYRVVWSESDGLPGVVVDRYEDQFAFQTQTMAMDQRKDLLVDAIRERFSPSCIIERNESPIRAAEGLEPQQSIAIGEPSPKRLKIGNVSFLADLWEGQKTGLYLDQLDNYQSVAKQAKGQRVLDCFSNQGGFALECAKADAAEVTAIDSSEPALKTAKENAEAENLEIRFESRNVFDFLKEQESAGTKYDLIILDPPSFTRNRKSLKDALRGYKEIHLRALKMLEPGGKLATFCCSHHVSAGDFMDVIRDASVDAKRTLRHVDSYGQRRDHPIIATIPESEYLRGYCFEVVPAW